MPRNNQRESTAVLCCTNLSDRPWWDRNKIWPHYHLRPRRTHAVAHSNCAKLPFQHHGSVGYASYAPRYPIVCVKCIPESSPAKSVGAALFSVPKFRLSQTKHTSRSRPECVKDVCKSARKSAKRVQVCKCTLWCWIKNAVRILLHSGTPFLLYTTEYRREPPGLSTHPARYFTDNHTIELFRSPHFILISW
jgi:hypothetical protein